jgi:hypothetical protein
MFCFVWCWRSNAKPLTCFSRPLPLSPRIFFSIFVLNSWYRVMAGEWGLAQWQSTCLACVRPWIPSLALRTKPNQTRWMSDCTHQTWDAFLKKSCLSQVDIIMSNKKLLSFCMPWRRESYIHHCFHHSVSCFVSQLGQKLMIFLPQPPECWDYGHAQPHPAVMSVFLLHTLSFTFKCISEHTLMIMDYFLSYHKQ